MTNINHNIRSNVAGDYPDIHPDAFIDPSAQIIGKVKIEKDVFVGPMSVIRADERGPDGSVQPIVIHQEVNIQDGVIIHSHGGSSVTIGPRTSVAHGVVIHGPCSIDEDCFLAIRSMLYSSTLGSSVWVGMGAIVMRTVLEAHTHVSAGSVILSRPDALGLKLVSANHKHYMEEVLKAAQRLLEDYIKKARQEKIESGMKALTAQTCSQIDTNKGLLS